MAASGSAAPETPDKSPDALTLALQRGEVDAARKLLDQTDTAALNPITVQQLASIYLRRRQWSDAAAVLSRLPLTSPMMRVQLNLARNMAAMQAHRPATYQQLITLTASQDVRLVEVKDGLLSIAQTDAKGQPIVLSPGGDPIAVVQQITTQLLQNRAVARPLGLCGLGDGYVLGALTPECWGPGHAFGQTPPIFVLEPQPSILLHNLMIHDWSQAAGPIASPRCIWCVGADWSETLYRLLTADTGLVLPQALLPQGMLGQSIAQQVQQLQIRLNQRQKELDQRISARASQWNASQLVQMLGPNPPRPPRALLMTSRFTTVLQHSTRDIADALQKLGWQTRIAIEQSPTHAVSSLALQTQLDQFQADLAITIDHLRSELGQTFPAPVPFVCWIQDELPNLTDPQAAAQISSRDFVLTHSVQHYVEHFHYPAPQCIHIPKLTRNPHRPAQWHSDGDDIVFVSNASKTIEQALDDVLKSVHATPGLEPLARTCCERVLSIYESGDCVQTLKQMRAILAQCSALTGITITEPALRERLVLHVFNTLNNILYRQQALQWIAQAAREMNLTLSLYGNGWDRHPQFAAYARGPVAYGPALEELTRRSKINLQIVPFSCLHQRLLDGLVAGGFFLIRQHPMDLILRDSGEFFAPLLPSNAMTIDDARAALAPELHARFDAHLTGIAQWADLPAGLDAMQLYRRDVAEGLGYVYTVPPRLDEVIFHDASTVRQQIARFVRDADLRSEIARQQREYVEAHFTYEAGMSRVLARIRDCIASEMKSSSSPVSPHAPNPTPGVVASCA